MVSVVPDSVLRRSVPAEHLDALPHAAQSVALAVGTAAPVVLNFQPARTVLLLEPHAARASLRMSHNIGDRLAHGQREHALLHGGKFHRRGSVTLHRQTCGLERGLGIRQFRDKSLRTISPNRVAHVGECLP